MAHDVGNAQLDLCCRHESEKVQIAPHSFALDVAPGFSLIKIQLCDVGLNDLQVSESVSLFGWLL